MKTSSSMNPASIDFKPIPFIGYNKSAIHDLVILQWWNFMSLAGDLETTFDATVRTPADLFELVNLEGWHFNFALDAQNAPWCVAWFAPFMSTIALGMWVRKDRRHTRDSMRAILQAMQWGVDNHASVIGVTQQKELLSAHERLGYTVLGEIPGATVSGGPAYVMVLTREAFEKAQLGRMLKRRPLRIPIPV